MSILFRVGQSLVASLCLLATCPVAKAQYSGGRGTVDDPYQIATATDLIALGETPDDYAKHFILTADIDLDPNLSGRKVFDRAVIAPDVNDVTESFDGTPFTGVFDGTGHVISRLRIVGVGYLGLFGQLQVGAVVCDLGLEAVNTVGVGDHVGALAGDSSGRITGCHAVGTVIGNNQVGGLVGRHNGVVAGSYTSGMVSGTDCVGGLLGRNGDWPGAGRVAASCHSTCTVSGNGYVGGLVGENYSGSILAGCTAGTVTGDRFVGGLVGRNSGTVGSSYSGGTVSGGSYVGGLVGRMRYGHVAMSCSTGAVTGTDSVGGLVGSTWHGRATSSFWDVEAAGESNSAGGTGLSTAEMHDLGTFLSAGWDLVDEVVNGTCDYWQISPGCYPRLRYHADGGPVMPEGSGTAEDPYRIRDARDLGTVWFEPMAYCRLEESVDLSGITWAMAVIPFFGGTFDGNGHIISNLHIEGSGYLGLFGQLESGGHATDLGLEMVDVKGIGGGVGGLVGTSCYASLANCYSTGIVRGETAVGGLVGLADFGSSITTSYSAATITGHEDVGGLVGHYFYTWMTNCYSTGTVSGDGHVGGLAGFSAQAFEGVSGCFWDIETSGQADSDGGTGLTTAEMQTASTFLEAGWDFVEETENGTDDNWWNLEGRDYPRLWWELLGEDPNNPHQTRSTVSVHRLWSAVYSVYAYTTDDAEIDNWLQDTSAGWEYQGVAFHALTDTTEPNTIPVYRFNSEILHHFFYTISEVEKDHLIQTYADIWTYQGVVFRVFLDEHPSDTYPVYRFWSPVFSGHFYTIDEAEKDEWIDNPNWVYEGVAWYAYRP